jgi:transposase-like protein
MGASVRPISYKRRRFPADVIRHAVWLHFRFALSFRDVEELLAQRGIEVSYETIRRTCAAHGHSRSGYLLESNRKLHLDLAGRLFTGKDCDT